MSECHKIEFLRRLKVNFKNRRRGMALAPVEYWAVAGDTVAIDENTAAIEIRLIPFRAKYCVVSFPSIDL